MRTEPSSFTDEKGNKRKATYLVNHGARTKPVSFAGFFAVQRWKR